MKLIKSSYEIIPQENTLEDIYKHIEKAARVCYKSEDKICEGSAKKMVDFLIKREHFGPLEHGTIYMQMNASPAGDPYDKYINNPYSKVVLYNGWAYITTNVRVLVENDWMNDLNFMCEPTKHHVKRISVKVICDRGVTHEWVRHRPKSYCQESSRYCNYSLDKFNTSVTFIHPDWVKPEDQNEFENDCKVIEALYFKWLGKGYTPQLARYFLNTGVKTEIFITAFTSDWKHFFKLRCDNAAHPDIRVLAKDVEKEFEELKYI